MRVYHRLIHIRDQKERYEDIPAHIAGHPVFKLTTKFRHHVQTRSAPIGKTSPLVVDDEGMRIFGELALVLRQQGSVVMIYLVACLLERLFGKETIDDIESIRGDLSIPDLIDGISTTESISSHDVIEPADLEMENIANDDEVVIPTASPIPLKPSATEWLSDNFGPRPAASAIFGHDFHSTGESTAAVSAFSSLSSSPNPFGSNAKFGAPTSTTPPAPKSQPSSQGSIPSASPLPSVAHFTPGSAVTADHPTISESDPPSSGRPSKTSSHPIFNAPPSLPKIDTQSIGTSIGMREPSVSPLPPIHPPPLNKKRPISLPTTPTTPVKSIPSKSLLDSVRSQVTSSGSPELLSPLYFPSPNTSPVRTFAGNGTLQAQSPSSSASDPPKIFSLSNGKSRQPAVDLDAMVLPFLRRCLLVKDCFDRWKQKVIDRAAWIEAYEHSDTYRQKIQHERKPRAPAPEKKRRASSVLFLQTPQKRIKKRISSEYKPPQTDEELAQRFKEVQLPHRSHWFQMFTC